MRSLGVCCLRATEVVLLSKLGENEVFYRLVSASGLDTLTGSPPKNDMFTGRANPAPTTDIPCVFGDGDGGDGDGDGGAWAFVVRAKNFSPLRTRQMMVCRNGELHNDDIVGAGFARPYNRPYNRPHNRHHFNGESHNDDIVRAKNLSPLRRMDYADRKSRRNCISIENVFNGELHNDDIVGAGFARPHNRPHHRRGEKSFALTKNRQRRPTIRSLCASFSIFN
jgi:hypothetical protein